MLKLETAEELIKFIKDSKKQTPVKVYVLGEIECFGVETFVFKGENGYILIGDWEKVSEILEKNKSTIRECYIENDRRNSGVPLLDTKGLEARIEPGAIIRDKVNIGKNAVVMMGAVINIGAEIGEGTMIDMNAVLGGRAIVGKRCHIGAGTVLAGVIEPPSATPVIVEDDVVIGANAVVIEGVRIGANSVVAAGAIVIDDVPPGVVVAGNPAKIIKVKDEGTKEKTKLVDDLRK
ncbi:MAG: 2,3,4,5-tetrahydropyridine-2,6-dicarboxylate N-acetyltransferase [Cetobacterium sp.]|uniref:2,3,4,5-tetrahydropyridine-2,6-dicarboxylate N-acetyltransferase n=2 Tax=Cetobacterium sp. TaxID=2071632 RepID=UPI002FC733DE